MKSCTKSTEPPIFRAQANQFRNPCIVLVLVHGIYRTSLIAMIGAELWWKGEEAGGTVSQAKELQLLVNQQARVTTGTFRTTNLGALLIKSGLRPATNQLENRLHRFGLRLLSLPQGEKARDVVGADTNIGKRLATALK